MRTYEPDDNYPEDDFYNTGQNREATDFNEPEAEAPRPRPAASPIGRLMEDDPGGQPSAYVKGFERNRRPEPSEQPGPMEDPRRRPERNRREERGGPIDRGADRGPDRNPDRNPERNPDRNPDRAPRERPAPDEDYYAMGIRDAQASQQGRDPRERRPRNPSPNPAMRAGVSTPRRMAGANARPQEGDEYPPEHPDDKYDTFRQRYNPDELISTTRGPKPPQRRSPRDVDLSASRGFQASRQYDAEEENDSISLVRWILVIGALSVLLLIIFLAVSRSNAQSRYLEAQERIDAMEETYNMATTYQTRSNLQVNEITILQNRIADLEAQLAGPVTTPDQPPGEAGEPDGEGATAHHPGLPTTHIVQSGQTLTAIAILHYGSGSSSQNQIRAEHIATYNGIPLNNMAGIHVGQELTIPLPPE